MSLRGDTACPPRVWLREWDRRIEPTVRRWNSTCTARNANKVSEIMTTSSVDLRCAVPPYCGEPPSEMPTGSISCIPAVPTHNPRTNLCPSSIPPTNPYLRPVWGGCPPSGATGDGPTG